MTAPRLILASASPARTGLLAKAGITHTVHVSRVDEEAVLTEANSHADSPLTPAETALLLARAKAEAVATQYAQSPDSRTLVLGCDSVFEFRGAAYGKPHRPEVAIERIRAMSGSSGTLHTGHWLIDTGTELSPAPSAQQDNLASTQGGLASAQVSFEELDPADIEAYVASGEPLEVAGSFTLDGKGSAFIRKVDGDPHAVIGLSISTLRQLLAAAGVPIWQLWETKIASSPKRG